MDGWGAQDVPRDGGRREDGWARGDWLPRLLWRVDGWGAQDVPRNGGRRVDGWARGDSFSQQYWWVESCVDWLLCLCSFFPSVLVGLLSR